MIFFKTSITLKKCIYTHHSPQKLELPTTILIIYAVISDTSIYLQGMVGIQGQTQDQYLLQSGKQDTFYQLLQCRYKY